MGYRKAKVEKANKWMTAVLLSVHLSTAPLVAATKFRRLTREKMVM